MTNEPHWLRSVTVDRQGRYCWTRNGVEHRTDRAGCGVSEWSPVHKQWFQISGTTQAKETLHKVREAAARNLIRAAASARGCKYRITYNGEVHFYGFTPGTRRIGWFFEAQSVEDAVARLTAQHKNA